MGRNDLKKLLDQKKVAKEKIFSKYWPTIKKRTPLLIIFAPEHGSSREVFFEILKGVLVLNVQVIVVSKNEIHDVINSEGRIIWFNPNVDSEERFNNYLMACDLAIIFKEPHDFIQRIFKYGIVLIGQEKSPFLENYNPNEETGNSFTFKEINPWDIFSSLVRASETYKFPYDWQFMIRGILEVR